MGESIAEGTIVRWIKKVGDKVDRDEPLFEISTDKVDAEIPSPAAGVVSEIRVKEGETVPVNSVVAVIGEAGASTSAAQAPAAASVDKNVPEPPKASPQADGTSTPSVAAPPPHYHDRDESDSSAPPPASAPAAAPVQPSAAPARQGSPAAGSNGSTEEAIRERSSPLVRKIA
jgi:2-oxoglutarate dehydrogenase E2 component (dihydrolipoamide succinyltransferase)